MDSILAFIGNFISILFGFIVTHLLGALAVLFFGNLTIQALVRALRFSAAHTRVKPAIIDLLTASVQVIGILILLSGALQALGLDQIALAVGSTITLIALGVATAASGSLGDIISGVFLASDPDFGTGFTIKTGELLGTIEHVDLRKTRLRAADGKLHVVPNKAIESATWIVEGRPNAPAPAPLFRRGGRPGAANPPGTSLPHDPPPHDLLSDLGATQPNHPAV